MKTTKRYGKKLDAALSLWVKLARAFATFNKQSATDIARYGFTAPQFGILECLGHLGKLTMGELGEKQLVSGGNITVVVTNLERRGIVKRTRYTSDHRTVHVQLTRNGKKIFQKIFPQHARFIAEQASVLSAKEQNELSFYLKKLGKEIEKLQSTEE